MTDIQDTAMFQTGSGLLLGPKIFQQKDQELRRSFSECSNNARTNQLIPSGGGSGSSSSEVVETVRCACCSVPEECTAAYIRRVRAAHCGSWVCGLCAEAVGERLRREPGAGVEAALRSHTAVCRDFNATTRLNPKLSLAGSMRDIARKSFNRRASSATTCHDELRASKDDGEGHQLPAPLLCVIC